MHSLGIDLASQPGDTGACLIHWAGGTGSVLEVQPGPLTDEALLELMSAPAVLKVGIDAPFGWPLAFIDAVSAYRDATSWLPLPHEEIRFRATEALVARETGQAALSVATSDLAWPAMRCARLLSQMASAGQALDRTGYGLVAEVYPAAALRRWGLIPEGVSPGQWSYKGKGADRRARRREILDGLLGRTTGSLELPSGFEERCEESDDVLDALLSALVARAVAVGESDPIPRGMGWVALREGWIHLPRVGSLERLSAVPSS